MIQNFKRLRTVQCILPDGAYLIVYADSNSAAPGLHADFALDQDGDEVRLYDAAPNGGALLDSVTFGPQAADRSMVPPR